jgi:hypothetical protein
MKKLIFYACIALVFLSCGKKSTVLASGSTSTEKWEIIQDYIVSGAPVSNERPLSNVLSEQEILIKAANYALKEGLLDTTYHAYQRNPALLSAKIETPILVTDAENGKPGWYLLTAVDADGVLLARMSFNSAVNTGDEEFAGLRGFALPGISQHFITKREAAELIRSQFPDDTVSEPVAIENLRLDDDPYSHMFFFWYFTVGDNAGNIASARDEYIIATIIPDYKSIPGGVTNRAAIGYSGGRGDFHLNGHRLAKLNKPLRLFDKLETARTAGNASFAPSNHPAESIGITPLPLK